MSGQSLGRSRIALRITRCSGATSGIVCAGVGDLADSLRHLLVESVVGVEDVDRVAVEDHGSSAARTSGRRSGGTKTLTSMSMVSRGAP